MVLRLAWRILVMLHDATCNCCSDGFVLCVSTIYRLLSCRISHSQRHKFWCNLRPKITRTYFCYFDWKYDNLKHWSASATPSNTKIVLHLFMNLLVISCFQDFLGKTLYVFPLNSTNSSCDDIFHIFSFSIDYIILTTHCITKKVC